MTNPMPLLVFATLATIASAPVPAVETVVSDLSGKYRCVSDIRPCQTSTFTISQSGRKLEVKSEQGQIGDAEVTSPLSISLGPPWNANGIILPDQRTIEWSAGTRWQRQ